ncbi:MAG: hypothetical protein ACRER8_09865 [Pseudomonas sp.]|uniref:hypothetical protein n=1 Tax=Pseudomonas sp. TaxID=306 RepID=UPI003D6DE70A
MAVAGKPYVFINDQFRHYPIIKAQVGGGAKFDHLNRHVYNTMVMPGQLMVVGDESVPRVSPEEAEMMRLAYGTHHSLFQNQARADGDIIKNYDLLQNMLGYGSLGIGAATGSWEKHLKGVEATLKDIEQLYQLALKRGTPIARQEFINQRRVHFAKLDIQLKGIAHWGTGLRNDGSIKKMLGISTKSYLHNQEIRGYTQRLAHIARASKLLRAGTPIGIGLNAWSSYLEIQEACSMGREDACTRANFVEGSMLVGGVGGGYAGGFAGTYACFLVLGALTGPGALACMIVGAAVVGYGGGLGGEKLGELIGTTLYEWRGNNAN